MSYVSTRSYRKCVQKLRIVNIFYVLCASDIFVFFFFSSRRRHTRLQGDWSSDVCSSDLRELRVRGLQNHNHAVPAIHAGDRAAIALVGVEVNELHRGSWIVTDTWLPTDRKSVV